MAVLNLTKDTWEEEVIKAKESLVVVEFYGDHCPKCAVLAPQYAEMSENQAFGGIKYCAVNTGSNRLLTISHKVMSQPSFLLYKEGKEVDRLTSKQPESP